MHVAQNLAVFILACQGIASIFLTIAYFVDKETFPPGRFWIPGFLKCVNLLRNTSINLMMAMYFLALVFVVFSYAGVVLLVIQLAQTFLL